MTQGSVLLPVLLLLLCNVDAQQGRRRVAVRRRPLNQEQSVNPASRTPNTCQIQESIELAEDPEFCNSFYKCENGTVTQQICENGLLFDKSMALTDAVHNYCVYSWKVDCGARPRDDTPISSPGCEYRFGLFAIGEGCLQSYYQCAFGQPTEVPCEDENENIPIKLGLSYDPASHSCGWPDQLLHLGCDPSQTFGFTCPALQDLIGTFNEQFTPFPRFAVGDAEPTYLICVDGQPRLQSCGSLDIFNPDTLECNRARQFFG